MIAFDIIPEVEIKGSKAFFSFLQLRFYFVSEDSICLIVEVSSYMDGYQKFYNPDLSPFQYTWCYYYNIKNNSDDIMSPEEEWYYRYFLDARREEHQRLGRESTKSEYPPSFERI